MFVQPCLRKLDLTNFNVWDLSFHCPSEAGKQGALKGRPERLAKLQMPEDKTWAPGKKDRHPNGEVLGRRAKGQPGAWPTCFTGKTG